MRKDHVSVILHERYHDESASQLVARRTGAQVVKLPTSVGGERGTGDYIKLMDHLVERTAAALGGK